MCLIRVTVWTLELVPNHLSFDASNLKFRIYIKFVEPLSGLRELVFVEQTSAGPTQAAVIINVDNSVCARSDA